MKLDLSLYLVANRGERSDEAFLNIVESAIKGGVSIVQLREKKLCAREIFALGLKLKKLCKAYKIPLIINDRIDIALALDADGVHLGRDDLSINFARKILGKNKIIGLSLKKLIQLENALEADYLGCGAVQTTPTKESEILPLEILREICTLSKKPVVAIGGIDENNLSLLKNSGICGVAVVRAIMNAKDPFQAAQNLKINLCKFIL